MVVASLASQKSSSSRARTPAGKRLPEAPGPVNNALGTGAQHVVPEADRPCQSHDAPESGGAARDCKKQVVSHWPNSVGVCRLSIGFFQVFLSFSTTQSMMPLFLQDLGFGDLGFYSLMMVYVSFGLSCIPIPPILSCVSPRRVLPLAALIYAVYVASAGLVASGLLPRPLSAACLLASSLLLGTGAACLWCSQGVILTHYAPSPLLNCYVSFFLACWTSSNVVGPFVAKTLLAYLSAAKMFLLLGLIAGAGAAILTGLPIPEGDVPPEPTIIAKSLREIIAESRGRLLHPVVLLRRDSRASRIACLSFMHGMALNAFPSATLAGIVKISMVSRDAFEVRQSLAWALTCAGTGGVVGSISFATLADKLGRRMSLGVVLVFTLLSFGLLQMQLHALPRMHPAISWVDVGAFTLGLANLICRGALNSLISATYKSGAVHAIVLMQMSISSGAVLGFSCIPHLQCQSALLLVLGGYSAAAFLALIHSSLFDESPASKIE